MAVGSVFLTGLGIAWASSLTTGCYTTGDGTAPPPDKFYYPVGMAVSKGGNVMYVANSDFDLQWNGGTVQSYDLHAVRVAAARQVASPPPDCPGTLPLYEDGGTTRQPLGETCAPQVDATPFVRDSVTIGAFATDIQLAVRTMNRLFVPVRGDATVTWFDVTTDDTTHHPRAGDATVGADTAATYPAFALDCGVRSGNRCDDAHHAGRLNDIGNTRLLAMPGEPFGMAQTEDGDYLVLTHQNETKSTLISTGVAPPVYPASSDGSLRCIPPSPPLLSKEDPSIQFVLDGMPLGGNGIYPVPHDPCAFYAPRGATAPSPPRPAFLQTSRVVAEIDLIRFYPDHGPPYSGPDGVPSGSSLFRPYIAREATFPVTANASGNDSRGIVIDDTPRRACKIKVNEDASYGADNAPARLEALAACARRAARVFIANRAPASMLIGEVGDASLSSDGSYNADSLQIYANVPLTTGPSKLFLAPIIDRNGNYALRVFIVCFDSQTIFIWDPDAGQVENIIHVAPGPFAMAFDPFDMDDVAARRPAPLAVPDPDIAIAPNVAHAYRFGYIASFTDSYVQVVDLDDTIVDVPRADASVDGGASSGGVEGSDAGAVDAGRDLADAGVADAGFSDAGLASAVDAGSDAAAVLTSGQRSTYERIVYTLGISQPPKGSH